MSRLARPGRAARSMAATIALGLLAFGPGALAQGPSDLSKHPMPAQGQPGPGKAAHGGGPSAKIRYHNGPLILGTTNAYVIWYGDWAGNPTPGLVEQFLGSDIGGSRYFNI